jgi:hypothetical protein
MGFNLEFKGLTKKNDKNHNCGYAWSAESIYSTLCGAVTDQIVKKVCMAHIFKNTTLFIYDSLIDYVSVHKNGWTNSWLQASEWHYPHSTGMLFGIHGLCRPDFVCRLHQVCITSTRNVRRWVWYLRTWATYHARFVGKPVNPRATWNVAASYVAWTWRLVILTFFVVILNPSIKSQDITSHCAQNASFYIQYTYH